MFISFSEILAWSGVGEVRVKGGMSLWNGMPHDLQNVIIMRNTIYAGNK